MCETDKLHRWSHLDAVDTQCRSFLLQVFGRVPGEYWLLCALECRLSLPAPISLLGMRYSLWMARAHLSFLPPIYHWMVQQDGLEFLSSSRASWRGGRITAGKTSGPLGACVYVPARVCVHVFTFSPSPPPSPTPPPSTHAYLEKLLSEAYHEMLFPRPSPSSQDPSFVASVKSFR